MRIAYKDNFRKYIMLIGFSLSSEKKNVFLEIINLEKGLFISNVTKL